jgi:hypothetical protein
MNLPKAVFAFDPRIHEVLFVGVRDFGVHPCDFTTGNMNSDVVSAVSYVVDIAGLIDNRDDTFVFGWLLCSVIVHYQRSWTPSTFTVDIPHQQRLHLATAVLYNALRRWYGRKMHVACALVEIILKHTTAGAAYFEPRNTSS